MMEKIKIITDSTADLSQELYDKYDIEVLPLLINFGDESYLDGVEINPEEELKRKIYFQLQRRLFQQDLKKYIKNI